MNYNYFEDDRVISQTPQTQKGTMKTSINLMAVHPKQTEVQRLREENQKLAEKIKALLLNTADLEKQIETLSAQIKK